jgi:hypothetical protein
MTSQGFFYFVAIFELYLLYSHHTVDASSKVQFLGYAVLSNQERRHREIKNPNASPM